MNINKMLRARKIPVQTRSVAGYFYSFKNKRNIDFESQLEKKFYLTFEFDDEIERYQEQPVKINSVLNGRKISYFPDCIVYFKPELQRKPLLVEIKYAKEIKEKKEKIINKIKVVSKYSKENGYLFKIFTDKKLNETYVDNLKFLYRYFEKPRLNGKYDDYENKIYKALANLDNIVVKNLLDCISRNDVEKMTILPLVWHLICRKVLLTDFNKPLSNSTEITLNKENKEGVDAVFV